jgi:hypothetical protein
MSPLDHAPRSWRRPVLAPLLRSHCRRLRLMVAPRAHTALAATLDSAPRRTVVDPLRGAAALAFVTARRSGGDLGRTRRTGGTIAPGSAAGEGLAAVVALPLGLPAPS